ncbi:MAG: ABC transporter permease [Solirubrobacterales bacterium]
MNTRIKPYIMLLPAATVLIGILAFGITTALLQSFGYMPIIGLKEFTIKYYAEIFKDSTFMQSFLFSLGISVTSSIIAVIFGVVLAYSLLTRKAMKNLEKIIYMVPIIVPHMAAAFFMFNIFSQSGLLSRVMFNLHIISSQGDFPVLIFDKYGIGIVLTYLWKEIPFVAMVVYIFFRGINKELITAAVNLGASRAQCFFNVLLPISMPSILSSFIIIFAFSFGAFEVPYLLGPTIPKTLPVQAYIEYTSPDIFNRPHAMALNIVLVAISILLVWFYDKALVRVCREVD